MPFIVVQYVKTATEARKIAAETPGVVGVYSLPRAEQVEVCPGFNGGCRVTSWTRDHTTGVMMHACGKRTRDWRKRIRGSLFDTLGINLLPRTRTPRMFQNPEGWGPTKKRPHSEE
jgi:hypothetical protein